MHFSSRNERKDDDGLCVDNDIDIDIDYRLVALPFAGHFERFSLLKISFSFDLPSLHQLGDFHFRLDDVAHVYPL